MHLHYTGINPELFSWLLERVKLRTQAAPLSLKLTMDDHLFIVLIKLKLGLTNKDIAYRFDVSFSLVSKIYRQWLPILALYLKKYIIWPGKPAQRRNLPSCFKPKYTKCICIIDCTEIFIERPLSLNTRAQTWSNYKNHNTIKYLVACAPGGNVSFISNGWGGRVSDKEITIKSGFLNHVERGDVILADRGFTVAEEIATEGGILVMPSFTKGKKQLPAKDVDKSRQIANVRIHIERVIGRLRKFNILNTTIPTTQVDLLDNVMVAVSGLVNLNKSVIPS